MKKMISYFVIKGQKLSPNSLIPGRHYQQAGQGWNQNKKSSEKYLTPPNNLILHSV